MSTDIITQSHAPVIAGIQIKQDAEGRLSLNDLHSAAVAQGANRRTKEPAKFIVAPQTVDLIDVLTDTQDLGIAPVSTVKGGLHQGTYVVKELVYAYAMWVNARFHLQVIRAYDEMQRADRFKTPQSFGEALRLAAEQQERLEAQAQKIALMQPQVQALHRLAGDKDTTLCLRDAAKHLQIKPMSIYPWLNNMQWIYRRTDNAKWVGYQARIDSGHIVHKLVERDGSDGSTKQEPQVRVTQKGLARLAFLISSGRSPDLAGKGL